MKIRFVLLLSLMLLSACSITINPTNPTPPVILPVLPTDTPALAPTPPYTDVQPPTATLEPRAEVAILAQQAVSALQNRDMDALAGLLSPGSGLRFSPYAFVTDENLLFTPDQVRGLLTDATVYLWGIQDGSGMPIDLTFADYYTQVLYRADFASAPQISFNQRIGGANSIDNAAEYYPGSIIVEYYFPGSEQYGGMDFQSLRLVFQQVDGGWHLVGLINDQWTV